MTENSYGMAPLSVKLDSEGEMKKANEKQGCEMGVGEGIPGITGRGHIRTALCTSTEAACTASWRRHPKEVDRYTSMKLKEGV